MDWRSGIEVGGKQPGWLGPKGYHQQFEQLVMSGVTHRGPCQVSSLCILSNDPDDRGGLYLPKICERSSSVCWKAELLFRELKIQKWPDVDFRKLIKDKTKPVLTHGHRTGERCTSSSVEHELLCKRHHQNFVAMR